MKTIKLSTLFVLLFMTQFNWGSSVNKRCFHDYARSYGNKAANLKELEQIIKKTNLSLPVKTQVPEFYPISHNEIVNYLKEYKIENVTAYQIILNLWEQFKVAQPSNVTFLTKDSRDRLFQIRKIILRVFTIENSQSIRPLLSKKMMRKAFDERSLLMVRSTGREDSQELANAGGNETIVGISPSVGSIAPAIGLVLASYFSEQSIGQRLIANDPHLFDEPFMPVLLQLMIGEKVGGADQLKDIPVSGVMFTQEMVGNTKGVVQIQSTFGQGEGVVNGIVPVDSYTIGRSNVIHPLISVKNERLIVPLGGGKTQFFENSRVLKRISSLDQVQLQTLRLLATAIEDYYHCPMDVEFVILHNVIYLVQARPLQNNGENPSYIKKLYLKKRGLEGSFDFSVIGPAGGAVRLIESLENVIIKRRISDALKEFLKSEEKELIKGIIVGENAPATSHEATVFRAAGKAVVYSENIASIKDSLAKKQSSFILDVQRGILLPFDRFEEFPQWSAAVEMNSWLGHPLPKKTSIMPEFLVDKLEGGFSPNNWFSKKKTNELLGLLKSDDFELIKKAGETLLFRLNKIIENEKKQQAFLKNQNRETNRNILNDLLNLKMAIYDALEELSLTLNSSFDRLERLYPVVFIEALLKQNPLYFQYVNDNSLAFVLRGEKEESLNAKQYNIQGKYRPFAVQYTKLTKFALNEEVKKLWTDFLQGMKDVEDKELHFQFATLIKKITLGNSVPLWINMDFFFAAKEVTSTEQIMRRLINEFQENEELLDFLLIRTEKLRNFDTLSFSEPKKVKSSFDVLKAISDDLMGQDFLDKYNESGDFVKMMMTKNMELYIEVMDNSIKTLTGLMASTDIKMKISWFKNLLYLYLEALSKWGALVDSKTMKDLEIHKKSFADIISVTHNLINRASVDEKEFYPSPKFNVSAAALGSKAVWDRSNYYMRTLEDSFTFIHQNLIVIISALNERSLSSIPEISVLKEAIDEIKKTVIKCRYVHRSDEWHRPNLIGIDFDYPLLKYNFNMALGNHSTTYQVGYHMKDETIDFTFQFYGIGGQTRWRDIGVWATRFSSLFNLNLFPFPVVSDMDIKAGWKLQSLDEVKKTAEFYFHAIDSTTSSENADWLSMMGDKEIEGFDYTERFLRMLEDLPEYEIQTLFGIKLTSFYGEIRRVLNFSSLFKEETFQTVLDLVEEKVTLFTKEHRKSVDIFKAIMDADPDNTAFIQEQTQGLIDIVKSTENVRLVNDIESTITRECSPQMWQLPLVVPIMDRGSSYKRPEFIDRVIDKGFNDSLGSHIEMPLFFLMIEALKSDKESIRSIGHDIALKIIKNNVILDEPQLKRIADEVKEMDGSVEGDLLKLIKSVSKTEYQVTLSLLVKVILNLKNNNIEILIKYWNKIYYEINDFSFAMTILIEELKVKEAPFYNLEEFVKNLTYSMNQSNEFLFAIAEMDMSHYEGKRFWIYKLFENFIKYGRLSEENMTYGHKLTVLLTKSSDSRVYLFRFLKGRLKESFNLIHPLIQTFFSSFELKERHDGPLLPSFLEDIKYLVPQKEFKVYKEAALIIEKLDEFEGLKEKIEGL